MAVTWGNARSSEHYKLLTCAVIDMYKEGWGKAVIARQHRIGTATVRRVLKRAGLWDSANRNPRHRCNQYYSAPVKQAERIIAAEYKRENRQARRHEWSVSNHLVARRYMMMRHYYKHHEKMKRYCRDKARERYNAARGTTGFRERQRKHSAEMRRRLSSGYIRKLLTSGTSLSAADIPEGLVVLQRSLLRLRRKAREERWFDNLCGLMGN